MKNSVRSRQLKLPAVLPPGKLSAPNGILLSLSHNGKRYVASFTPIEMKPNGSYALLLTDLMNGSVPLFASPRFSSKAFEALWLSVTTASTAVVKALEAGNPAAAKAAIENAVNFASYESREALAAGTPPAVTA